MTKELTMRDFENELKTMAESCVGVKEATARSKASDLFKKYEELISYSKSEKEYYVTEYYRNRGVINVLKTGKVVYEKGDDALGVISIKDMEQIEVRENDVLLITKTGREITLSKDFEYLRDIF